MKTSRMKSPLATNAQIAFLATVCIAIAAWWVQWAVAAEPANANSAISKPSANAALIVKLTSPTSEVWPQSVQATGAIAGWQEAVIGAETGNLRITEILVDVGSVVKKGQLMAQLADATVKADLDKQNAAVDQAQANLFQAQKNLARVRSAADSGALSNQKIDEYLVAEVTARASLASVSADRKSANIRLQQTRILAVDDGVVTSRTAILGNVISSGAELFRLVRQGKMEWRAELGAEQLGFIRPGQNAELSLPGGAKTLGVVRLVSPTLSTATGRALVFVSLPPASGAQLGMFVSGSIELAQSQALTLPQSAVVLRDGRNDVYLMTAAGDTVTRRTIQTGRHRGERVEVVSGLDRQSRVVASGGAFLSEGVRVRIEAGSGQPTTTTPKS